MALFSGYISMGDYGFVKIDRRYKAFLSEISDDTERGLLITLYSNPLDSAARAAYTDYLLERGRNKTATAIRNGWTPGIENKIKVSSYQSCCSSGV